MHPESPPPLCHGQSYAIQGKWVICALIVCLLLLSSPSTILHPSPGGAFVAVATRVTQVIVDPVDGVIRGRPFSHILKEIAEGIPSFTKGDAPPLVRVVIPFAWIQTSLPHLHPRPPCRRFAQPMLSGPLFCQLPLKASTGLCSTLFKNGASNQVILPAFTTAKPYQPARWLSSCPQGGQSPEDSSGQIRGFRCVLAFSRWSFNHVVGIAHFVDGLMFSGCGLLKQIAPTSILG